MKEIRTEIIIDAPASRVWQILTDRSRWPEWNPAMLESTGPLELGKRIRNVMPNGTKTITFRPVITDLQPGRRLEWLGSLWVRGLFDGRHYFELTERNGQTTLVHGEHFSGLLRGPILKKVGQQTLQAFVAMNQALKVRAESNL